MKKLRLVGGREDMLKGRIKKNMMMRQIMF